MEADISCGTDEERFEEVLLGQLVDVLCDVDVPTGDGNGAPEA